MFSSILHDGKTTGFLIDECLIARENKNELYKEIGVKGNFSSKHSANESFVGISKCCNPINRTSILGKKIL
jgi:hypothetical protein